MPPRGRLKEREGERRAHSRTYARRKGGSGVPYTVTFVKARLSPYTGNVRDGRHLYRARVKSQECCFLSRLLYTYRRAPSRLLCGKWRGRKSGVRKRRVATEARERGRAFVAAAAFRAFQLVPHFPADDPASVWFAHACIPVVAGSEDGDRQTSDLGKNCKTETCVLV